MLDIKIDCDEQRENISGIGSMFLAPEITSGKIRNDQASKKADIWSLGVIIYLLITGNLNLYKNNKQGRQKASPNKITTIF